MSEGIAFIPFPTSDKSRCDDVDVWPDTASESDVCSGQAHESGSTAESGGQERAIAYQGGVAEHMWPNVCPVQYVAQPVLLIMPMTNSRFVYGGASRRLPEGWRDMGGPNDVANQGRNPELNRRKKEKRLEKERKNLKPGEKCRAEKRAESNSFCWFSW